LYRRVEKLWHVHFDSDAEELLAGLEFGTTGTDL
jgi:hypothetical protein